MSETTPASEAILDFDGRMEWEDDYLGSTAPSCDGVCFFISQHCPDGAGGQWMWHGYLRGASVVGVGSSVSASAAQRACEEWIAQHITSSESGVVHWAQEGPPIECKGDGRRVAQAPSRVTCPRCLKVMRAREDASNDSRTDAENKLDKEE